MNNIQKRIAEANYEGNLKLGKEVNYWNAENIKFYVSDKETEELGYKRHQ